MTPEEQAVIDAAIKYVQAHIQSRYDRWEWALVQAVESLPDARVTNLHG